jgi:hypothetical protein
MRKLRLPSFLSLAFIVIITSCTKEGPEGPVGGTGPQGVPGISGAPGAPGAPGPAGSANVIYSAWFETGTGWTANGADDYLAEFLYDKAAPGVTQSVIDNGIVLGFMKGDPNLTGAVLTQAFPLPNTVGHLLDYIDTYDFVLNTPGNIRFLYKTNLPFFDEADLGAVSYRYVIIPGGVAGGRVSSGAAAGYNVEALKKMTYRQVAALFGIPADGSNIR